MKRLLFCVFAAFALPLLGIADGETEVTPGAKSEEMFCTKGGNTYSYFLYFPAGYDAQRAHPWPVMFLMDPGGGSQGTMDLYTEGADRNGFVLAVSVQSKNGNPESEKAVLAMVGDVLAKQPVDPARGYASGFSGGARMAFWLSGERKRNIIGLLPCGAGCVSRPFNEKAAAYGLSGSTCFNRWDMAITFNKRIRKNGLLKFFPGGHEWGSPQMIREGMDWLNGRFLAGPGRPEPSYAAEKAAYGARILKEIERRQETEPEYAYEWSLLLGQLPVPEAPAARALAQKLGSSPRILRYLEARKAVDRFVDKHFNTDVMDYQKKPVTDAMARAAQELGDKFGDTVFAPLFPGFGSSSASP